MNKLINSIESCYLIQPLHLQILTSAQRILVRVIRTPLVPTAMGRIPVFAGKGLLEMERYVKVCRPFSRSIKEVEVSS